MAAQVKTTVQVQVQGQQTQAQAPERGDAASAEVRQFSLLEILAVWAAAAVPMGLLSWVVAPWLADWLSGGEPLAQALLLLFTAGLIWQGVLVLLLVYREQRMLRWSRLRAALWLRKPRDPRSGRAGGRVWLWLIPFFGVLALEQLLPSLSGPLPRDFGAFMASDRGPAFFQGAWGWFAVVVVLAIFNTALGEELLFRGLLLPRMRGVFGRADWLANGILFATYHLHQPWTIPTALLDSAALIPLAPLPQRLDGDHRPLDPERDHHHRRPGRRAALGRVVPHGLY